MTLRRKPLIVLENSVTFLWFLQFWNCNTCDKVISIILRDSLCTNGFRVLIAPDGCTENCDSRKSAKIASGQRFSSSFSLYILVKPRTAPSPLYYSSRRARKIKNDFVESLQGQVTKKLKRNGLIAIPEQAISFALFLSVYNLRKCSADDFSMKSAVMAGVRLKLSHGSADCHTSPPSKLWQGFCNFFA